MNRVLVCPMDRRVPGMDGLASAHPPSRRAERCLVPACAAPAAAARWCCGQQQFINFVRQRGLAVIATRGSDGSPQAALVGITATGRGELVFDTSRSSRKYRNLSAFAQVALVIGWENEMTVQCEGTADTPTGADRDRCLQAYFARYPDGVERAHDQDIVHVRVRPRWLRYSDYRPGSIIVEETTVN